MGGYQIGEKNRARIDKHPHLCRLICAFCNFLSKEPTVSMCGHVFCRSCIIESSSTAGSFEAAVCPVDGSYLNLEECQQDVDAAEEINTFVVFCVVNTCNWRGSVQCLEDHLKEHHEGRQEGYAKACGSKDGEPSQVQQSTVKKIMEMEIVQRKHVVEISELKLQLSAFADAVASTQGFGQFQNDVRALAIKIQEQEILTGNAFDGLNQQLNTLQHKVQTWEQQLKVQKDQCSQYHVECLVESGRTCEERNMEVEILQGSVNHLKEELADLKNRFSDLQTRHADLENRYVDLQNRHANLQSSHNTLQAQVSLGSS